VSSPVWQSLEEKLSHQREEKAVKKQSREKRKLRSGTSGKQMKGRRYTGKANGESIGYVRGKKGGETIWIGKKKIEKCKVSDGQKKERGLLYL